MRKNKRKLYRGIIERTNRYAGQHFYVSGEQMARVNAYLDSLHKKIEDWRRVLS